MTSAPASTTLNDAALLAARLLLAALFIIEGLAKLNGWSGAQAYMQSYGVPGALLPAVIAVEIGGGLALIAGWQTAVAATALALFCVAAALLFHAKLSDHGQALHFWKDIAIAGGFLALAAAGPGRWSFDGARRRRAGEQS